jgi:FkbM family methyltransferase
MSSRSLQPLPVGFHGDRHLLRLIDLLAARAHTFLETGSNVGSTLGYVARRFPALDCISCEPDPAAHAVAAAHACVRPGVALHRETSQELLRRLARDHVLSLAKPLLAWLDAHDHGFEWPLRDEVAFLTGRCARGFLLVDDFRVPHDPRFGWDSYDGRHCSFEYIRDSIAPDVYWRLYYPAYSEHTSPHHPLRGWGLLQFDRNSAQLEHFEDELSEVCSFACEGGPAPKAVPAPSPTPEPSPELLQAALATFAKVLEIEPRSAVARRSWKALFEALHPAPAGDPRSLPIAPGAWGRMARRDPYDDLRDLVSVERPTIVDGGANRGDTVARLRALFPDATIHAFEPIEELAQAIRTRFAEDCALVVHAAALAAESGAARFHRLAADVTSSLLTPSALKRRYHGARVEVTASDEVVTLALADVLDRPIDVLKLDLQGSELSALRGLRERIADVRVVLTEVEFAPLYDGQPLFGDLDVHLRGAGFRLFHLYDVWSHPDGQVTSGDALYVNGRFFS